MVSQLEAIFDRPARGRLASGGAICYLAAMRRTDLAPILAVFALACDDSNDTSSDASDSAVADISVTDASSSETTPSTDVGPETDVAPTGRALLRHDVSILFPLPATDALWRASHAGLGGPLVPETEFAKIARSLTIALPDESEYAALRVVGVRFDPCFRMTLTSACQPQVRLVLQAVDPVEGAFDGALHALYNIAPAAWPGLVADLRALALDAPENVTDLGLGPSPALAAQGMDGAYARGLEALVAAHAGPDTLARLTFMTRTNARTSQWEFGGSHLGDWPGTDFPAAGPVTIVGASDETLQTVTLPPTSGFRFSVGPEFADPVGRPGVDTDLLDAMDRPARAAVHAWAVAQEDPDALLPDTTDCAACHLAGRIGGYLEALDPTLVTPALAARRGPRRTSPAEDNRDNLRAFGWFFHDPHVAQRTANETEAVVRALAATP